jgi:group II intron reverse transcriptase/maturase
VLKPTTEILERMKKNSTDHPEGVHTRLYRYLLREDTYYDAYQKLYANKGAATKGIDNDTADGFGKKYVDTLIAELVNGTYRPKPVRREYIQKANGKLRPLGIPSFRDKLLQEVIRRFLEAIYEPQFNDCSHGFRPNRSCHTALKQARCYFVGAKWFIEGDIKGCFDNIDHAIMIGILERKIKDSRFINIIRAFLKAGYVEDLRYNQTYSGTPQGGILSPILANIYLNELDAKVMEIKARFEKPRDKVITTEYRRLKSRIDRLEIKAKAATGDEKSTIVSEIKALKKQRLSIPCTHNSDKNIAYIRYADDFLLAVKGAREDCSAIKAELAEYLQSSHTTRVFLRDFRITSSQTCVPESDFRLAIWWISNSPPPILPQSSHFSARSRSLIEFLNLLGGMCLTIKSSHLPDFLQSASLTIFLSLESPLLVLYLTTHSLPCAYLSRILLIVEEYFPASVARQLYSMR